MSLFLLLLALQGAEPVSDPPPLKIKIAPASPTTSTKPAVAKTPTGANPTITYVPAKPKADDSIQQTTAAASAPAPRDGSPLASVSEAARSRLAEEKQADAARRAELRREMTEVQSAIARSLGAEPLDLVGLKAALERRDQVMAKSRSKVTLAVLDLLGDIPPEDRLRVAKALIESDPSPQRTAAEQKPKPATDGR